MTTEELYALMQERWQPEFPDQHRLKKGLLGGSYICFDTYMTIQPRVKVKETTVHITRSIVENNSSTIGGIDLNTAAQMIDQMKNGANMLDVMMAAPEYFLKVCAGVKSVLKDKIIPEQ